MTGEIDTSDDLATGPAEPKRLTVRLERSADRLELVSVQRQWCGAVFLLVWLSIWTADCVAMLVALIAEFSFFLLLFAIPFWAAELFVLFLVALMTGSREQFELDVDGARYRWSIYGLPLQRRRVPLGEIVGFERHLLAPLQREKARKSVHVANPYQVRMETTGAPQMLPGGASNAERDWLAHVLDEMLTTLKRFYAPIDRTADDESQAALPVPSDLPAVLELRPPSSTQVPAPSDSTWRLHYDFDAITFTQRGGIALSTLGFLLFITAFWNGITGIFVAGLFGFMPGGKSPQGMEWWFLFFFLIPFELIGLVMILALVSALLEPLRRTRWILSRSTVTRRVSCLGIGRSHGYEIRELDRLELRKADGADDQDTVSEEADDAADPPAVQSNRDDSAASPDPGVRFELALIDRTGSDVCELENLTLGEACWIADVILRERSGWFGR